MSDEDLRLAFTPGIVHLILSLAEPEHPDLRGYCVEQGHPVSAGIVVLPPAPSEPADAKGDAAT